MVWMLIEGVQEEIHTRFGSATAGMIESYEFIIGVDQTTNNRFLLPNVKGKLRTKLYC